MRVINRNTVLLGMLLCIAAGHSHEVKSLKCEHLTDPLAVNTCSPRFSWKIDGCKQQTAYSIH